METITSNLSLLDADKIKAVLTAALQVFQPNNLSSIQANTEVLKKLSDDKVKKESDLSIKLANLEITSAASVNAFEINVIDKLSKSLTKLKIQGISEETNAKISGLSEGNNSYTKAGVAYATQISGIKIAEQTEVKRATSDFTNGVGNIFVSETDNFIKGLIDSKNKGADFLQLHFPSTSHQGRPSQQGKPSSLT